jgi:hypothetical protein
VRRHPYPSARDDSADQDGERSAYLRAAGFVSEEERRTYFERLVSDWPPLTERQRVRLAMLLRAADH